MVNTQREGEGETVRVDNSVAALTPTGFDVCDDTPTDREDRCRFCLGPVTMEMREVQIDVDHFQPDGPAPYCEECERWQ